MKNISQEKLRAVIVPQPPRDEQVRIATTIDAVAQRATVEGRYLAAAQALKTALMSVLLSGEVRVNPDSDPA